MNSGRHIISQSGRLIDVMHPKPEDFTVEDIAAGLVVGRTERYGSRTENPYYVAEHSVHVANLLAKRFHDGNVKRFPVSPTMSASGIMFVKAGALHDAAEAYLGDIVQPLKACLPDYKRIEHSFEVAIAERFQLLPELFSHRLVKGADNDIFHVEVEALAVDAPSSYGLGPEYIDRVQELYRTLPTLHGIGSWDARRAKKEFLDLCHILEIK